MGEFTRILASLEQGSESATAELFKIVYDELRRLAAQKLRHESPGHTLQATALVHEAYLRLVAVAPDGPKLNVADGQTVALPATHGAADVPCLTWQSRGHFFAAAAEAMRRILVENARRKGRLKRGGGLVRVELEQVEPANAEAPVDLLALDEALGKLEIVDKVKSDVVKLRYFTGLTIEETGAALGVSEASVKRHWTYARAWLRREMGEVEPD